VQRRLIEQSAGAKLASMRVVRIVTVALLVCSADASAQSGADRILITVPDRQISSPAVFVAYGDMRFTDTAETIATNPKVRRWLVEQIALEKPAAIVMSGDVPYHGQEKNDYAVFAAETKVWQTVGIFVSAALGNHELNGTDRKQCLENWWTAFPKLRGKRWYAAALGSKVLVLNLDSLSPLTPQSEQQRWIIDELAHLPGSVKFVFFNLHHPPLADVDPSLGDDHNARPNEIALATLLQNSPARKQAAFVVTAGHIHNYERFFQDGITYLVSGGGGAAPRTTLRDPRDLYMYPSAVNYHYVKFVLKGDTLMAEMIRLAEPSANVPVWEVRDRFEVKGP
jgi:hypothetical protein